MQNKIESIKSYDILLRKACDQLLIVGSKSTLLHLHKGACAIVLNLLFWFSLSEYTKI